VASGRHSFRQPAAAAGSPAPRLTACGGWRSGGPARRVRDQGPVGWCCRTQRRAAGRSLPLCCSGPRGPLIAGTPVLAVEPVAMAARGYSVTAARARRWRPATAPQPTSSPGHWHGGHPTPTLAITDVGPWREPDSRRGGPAMIVGSYRRLHPNWSRTSAGSRPSSGHAGCGPWTQIFGTPTCRPTGGGCSATRPRSQRYLANSPTGRRHVATPLLVHPRDKDYRSPWRGAVALVGPAWPREDARSCTSPTRTTDPQALTWTVWYEPCSPSSSQHVRRAVCMRSGAAVTSAKIPR